MRIEVGFTSEGRIGPAPFLVGGVVQHEGHDVDCEVTRVERDADGWWDVAAKALDGSGRVWTRRARWWRSDRRASRISLAEALDG